ncbi:MAG TPA: hypothetical protein VNJ01_07215 [Bacteriovoracaceae bacterium]|nr:hypothetical protein [Bacteriovoracaceae bacterium]
MEEFNTKIPLFKKLDRYVFQSIDKFKLSTGYNGLQDFYNSLEEEQQKVFKALVTLGIFIVPAMLLAVLYWQNNNLKDDLNLRISLVTKANEIIGQSKSLREVGPAVLSDNPIDGAPMMTSRLSNLLSQVGVDLAKLQVNDFEGSMISTTIMRAEANFTFSNVSTDELMNIFTSMIQREKFRVSSVEINRNADTNLLQGKFHAIHFSNAVEDAEEE